ncbi:NADH-quinone oxidoreductase subunit L, partial [Herbaspirillum frisingense]
MTTISVLSCAAWAAPGLMFAMATLAAGTSLPATRLWRCYQALSGLALLLALLLAVAALFFDRHGAPWPGVLGTSTLGLVLALLVQGLGTVIGSFSARYLQGEGGQRQYIAALSVVLMAVHLLLLADHWLVLIVAWALVGLALEKLLCFYPDRPFARLA